MSTYPFQIPSGINIIPDISGNNNLGTASKPLGTIFASALSGVTIGSTFTGGAITSDFTPTTSGTLNIGTSSLPFSGINTNNLFIAGVREIPQKNISFLMDNGPSVITSGNQGFISIPYACNITGWNLIANVSGSITMDVYRQSYTNWTIESGLSQVNSITAGTNPLISNASKNQNTNVSWSGLSANDILEFVVSGTTTSITRASLTLTIVPA